MLQWHNGEEKICITLSAQCMTSSSWTWCHYLNNSCVNWEVTQTHTSFRESSVNQTFTYLWGESWQLSSPNAYWWFPQWRRLYGVSSSLAQCMNQSLLTRVRRSTTEKLDRVPKLAKESTNTSSWHPAIPQTQNIFFTPLTLFFKRQTCSVTTSSGK